MCDYYEDKFTCPPTSPLSAISIIATPLSRSAATEYWLYMDITSSYRIKTIRKADEKFEGNYYQRVNFSSICSAELAVNI